MMKDHSVKLNRITPKELAALYEVKPRILHNWLKKHESEIGERVGHFYTALQVRIIYDKLGYPGNYSDDE